MPYDTYQISPWRTTPHRVSAHRRFARVMEDPRARSRRWARLVVDEPQDMPAGTGAGGVPTLAHVGARFRWALCGTATEHVREIAELLLFDEPCRDDDARALAAIALVHRRADTYPNPGQGPNLNPNPEL